MSEQRPVGWRRVLRFFPADPARDVDDELDFHIEARAAEYERAGMSPDEARAKAQARFGDRMRARAATLGEDARHARSERRASMVHDFGQDIRFASRTLRRQRLPAILAAVCVALGIGATTAVLSVGDALLLRPLPFPNGARLIQIGTESPGQPLTADQINSLEDYTDWRARARSFSELGAIANATITLGTTDPVRATATLSTASLWQALGVHAERGRVFTAAEDRPGGPRVALVSHGYAQRAYGSVDSAVGKQLTINGRVHDVIGVLAAASRFPDGADLWLPLAREPREDQRGNRSYTVIGALKPNVSIETARAEMTALAAVIAKEHPEHNEGRRVAIAPLREHYVGAARDGFRLAAAAALLVLLVACANVACLQLARGSARAREMQVRVALGASRARLVRQLLTENVLLALAGGAAGVAVGIWGTKYVGTAVAANAPSWMAFHLSVGVLAATTAVCMAAGVLFGIAPAFGLTRRLGVTSLRVAGASMVDRGQGRAQRALAVAELALTLVLVTTATLAVESFMRLSNVPTGFDAANLQTFRLSLRGSRYDSADARRIAIASIVDGLRRMPGIQGATATTLLPIRDCCSRFGFSTEGTALQGKDLMVTGNMVTPGHFAVMRTPIVRGRDFTDADRAGTQNVIIISETMAKMFWPGEDPIGKTVHVSNGATVVGVVADIKQSSLVDAPEPQFYRPHAQDPWEDMSFAVRVTPGTVLAAKDVRAVVHAVDPVLPVGSIVPMTMVMERTLAPKRVFGALFTAFAAVALALAVAGIYGVLAFQVSRRGQEIGVRMALGAERPRVLRTVLGQAARLGITGVVIGVAGALIAARALAHTLYGVSWTAPWRYAAVVGFLMLATLAAAFGPAWRASRVDPMRALRGD
ncbi:MAG TPA: ABC transporter permease [Gemmatimonadaceae bacterium]|nr:ABC transporter permease [Gemmatimonadaceae bacterium]